MNFGTRLGSGILTKITPVKGRLMPNPQQLGVKSVVFYKKISHSCALRVLSVNQVLSATPDLLSVQGLNSFQAKE